MQVPFIKLLQWKLIIMSFKIIASKKTAIILSTGMSTYDEIIDAVEVIKSSGNENLAVLHCVSIYALNPTQANLNNIIKLREMLQDIPIGYSDHTIGADTAIAATAIGSPIIESILH